MSNILKEALMAVAFIANQGPIGPVSSIGPQDIQQAVMTPSTPQVIKVEIPAWDIRIQTRNLREPYISPEAPCQAHLSGKIKDPNGVLIDTWPVPRGAAYLNRFGYPANPPFFPIINGRYAFTITVESIGGSTVILDATDKIGGTIYEAVEFGKVNCGVENIIDMTGHIRLPQTKTYLPMVSTGANNMIVYSGVKNGPAEPQSYNTKGYIEPKARRGQNGSIRRMG
jgi:hypothetical protein